jgi:hypothetical protein
MEIGSWRAVRAVGALVLLGFALGGCGLAAAMDANVERDDALAAYRRCLAAHASDTALCDSAARTYLANLSNAHQQHSVLQ